jgi:DNA-directed RNA polymerase subunit RPC12/RpoP
MECPCGHPIVHKKDIAIVMWKREQYYLHTECLSKYFTVMPSGYCVPTRALLDIIEHKRIVEEKVEAPEVEPAMLDDGAIDGAIPAEIKCPNCGGQAAYSATTKGYVCLDCQSTIPVPEPSK